MTDYTVVATAGSGGSIDPSGTVTVPEGTATTFVVQADAGYYIDYVMVDAETNTGGIYVSRMTFTFPDSTTGSHTISAIFGVIPTREIDVKITPNNGIIRYRRNTEEWNVISTITTFNINVITGVVQISYVTPPTGKVFSHCNYVYFDSTKEHQSQIYTLSDNSAFIAYDTFTEDLTGNTYLTGHIEVIAVWNDIVSYSVSASAGEGGTISPSGTVITPEGEERLFTITSDIGYHIKSIKVDDIDIEIEEGEISKQYVFTSDTTGSHTIVAEFEQDPVPPAFTAIRMFVKQGGSWIPLFN